MVGGADGGGDEMQEDASSADSKLAKFNFDNLTGVCVCVCVRVRICVCVCIQTGFCTIDGATVSKLLLLLCKRPIFSRIFKGADVNGRKVRQGMPSQQLRRKGGEEEMRKVRTKERGEGGEREGRRPGWREEERRRRRPRSSGG